MCDFAIGRDCYFCLLLQYIRLKVSRFCLGQQSCGIWIAIGINFCVKIISQQKFAALKYMSEECNNVDL